MKVYIQSNERQWLGALVMVLAAFGVLYGISEQLRVIQPANALVTREDLDAMSWVRENTAPGARFLVNGFIAYGGTSVVGADAGWWIPLLALRENMVPPLTYRAEAPSEPGYRERVGEEFSYVERVLPTSREGIEYLRELGVAWVYVGQRNGMVGNPGKPLLDVEALRNCPDFTLAYHQDDVWVFSLDLADR